MTGEVEVTVRRGTAGDYELLAEMGARTFVDAYSADIAPEMLAEHVSGEFGPAEQARELAEPGTVFLIAEVADLAAGYAKMAAEDVPESVSGKRPVELNRIYVETEWIGRGVGPTLMRACLEEAAAAGYDAMWLGVWERNARAIAFYCKWGFAKVGTHTFVLTGKAMTDVLMERRLE